MDTPAVADKVTLSFEDWSYAHVWVFFPIFYFGAIGILSSRYQGE